MNEGANPVSVGPGEGTTIEGPVGGPITFKVRGEQTAGGLTVLEHAIASNDGPPLHIHGNEDESFYVLTGRLRFKLGGQIREAPAGSFVSVPRRTPHCFQNVGNDPASILVIFTPSGMEHFFDRFAELENADPEELSRLGAEVGMDIVGPPLAVSDPA